MIYVRLNKKDLINIEKTTKCRLPNIHDEYIILYSRNGACNTLKKNDIVFSDIDRPNDLKMYKFIRYDKDTKNYIIFDEYRKKKINVEKVIRFCGSLNDKYLIKNLFLDENKRLTSVKKLIKPISFFIKNHIIHCDIKNNNIVGNEKLDIKVIDFGAAFSLDSNKIFNFEKINDILNDLTPDNFDELIYNKKVKNFILDYISIHTEYYTPPEILVLKLLLLKYDIVNINKYIIRAYAIDTDDEKKEELNKVIKKIFKNKVEIFKNLFIKNKSILYKFDIFSLGVVLEEIKVTLLERFDIKIEPVLINLIENLKIYDYSLRYDIKKMLNHEYLK